MRRAVERTGLPALLQLHPASMDFGGAALIAAAREVASGCRAAPILVQLDHAMDGGAIGQALEAGVRSPSGCFWMLAMASDGL